MQLEFHQLDRRWEHLRVRQPGRQRRLLASLAECGQQVPIVVVAVEGEADRYVIIDGFKRMAALQQLGRDTVEAVVWPMSEAAAVLLDRSLRLCEHETALETGWLLAELEQRFGYSLEELARRFDRSVSWVSRRLALVELPEAIQQQVREGRIAAQAAMKFLAPVARQSLERLSADGSDLYGASLRQPRGRPAVCGLAPGIGRDRQTHSGRSRAVFQNAAAGENPGRVRERTDPRSGDGRCDGELRAAAARRRAGSGAG
jgi:ParB family chromosome partitioning protein